GVFAPGVNAERRRRKHVRMHIQPDDSFAFSLVHCLRFLELSKRRMKADGHRTIRYAVLHHVGVFRRRPITDTESNSSAIIGRLQLPLAGFHTSSPTSWFPCPH